MWEILFLLLPIAAFSGWYIGRKTSLQQASRKEQKLSGNYYSGLNYLLNEQPDKAVDAFLQILDLDNEMIEIHLMLGNLFRRRGEVDRAIRIHQGLLARSALSKTQKAIFLLELGKDYYNAGMYDRAEELFIRLIDIGEQQLESSLDYLLNIYEQAHDWNKAIATAEKLQSLTNKNLSINISHYYCELAEQAKNQKDFKLAQKLSKKAIRINKGCVRASILYGNILKETGKYKQAIKLYKQVYLQAPRYLSAAIAPMADCYKMLRDVGGLIGYLRGCLAAGRENPNMDNPYINKPPGIYAVLQFVELLNEEESPQSAICYITEYLREYPSLQGLNKVVELHLQEVAGKFRDDLHSVASLVKELLVKEPRYKCASCGFPSNTLQWQCPGCRRWGV